MISFNDVFNWLNYNDATHLSAANQLSVLQLDEKEKIPVNHYVAIKSSLLRASETCVNELEALELKVALAKYNFIDLDFEAAKNLLNYAVAKYPKSSHRSIIASWLLGLSFWQNTNYEQAYKTFHAVQKSLSEIAGQNKPIREASKIYDWYAQKLELLNLDLTCTAEEAFDWLTLWDASHLTSSARILADAIKERAKNKQFLQAFDISTQLAAVTKNRMDSSETAEAWIMIGLAAYQMGEIRLAIEYWKRGASAYLPYSHGQAVARWMMGIAQWNVCPEYTNAMKNWRTVIETFTFLQIEADHENDQKKREWYARTTEMMRQALDRAIRDNTKNCPENAA